MLKHSRRNVRRFKHKDVSVCDFSKQMKIHHESVSKAMIKNDWSCEPQLFM